MNPALPIVDITLRVTQVIKVRDRGLGRGPQLTSELRSPTGSLKILQCNINGLPIPATRTKLEQLIDIADRNGVQISWGCSTNNDRGNDLLNAADDRALIVLNSGLPTHTSFSYGTSEALDITLVSPELLPHCDWHILSSIGSGHLPIIINLLETAVFVRKMPLKTALPAKFTSPIFRS
ncbi:hypothetical protein TNCV_3783021 [Trichonephila clavipes]|nr:hypothetical protein TNCV_3783021 [Trichonephila clavipes]